LPDRDRTEPCDGDRGHASTQAARRGSPKPWLRVISPARSAGRSPLRWPVTRSPDGSIARL